jgi:RND family efflux transporter MFP subunit
MTFTLEKMKYLSLLWVGVLATVTTACGPATEETAPEAAQAASAMTIEITEVQRRNNDIQLGPVGERRLSGTLKVNGVIEVPPQNLVSLNAKMGGFVKSTDLLQGLPVRKGQGLAVIENQEFITLQQDYLDGQSRLGYLQAEYDRQKQLSAENVSAQKIFQQVSADYGSLQARLKAIEARLKLVNVNLDHLKKGHLVNAYTIYSPVDGIVTVVNINLGKSVTAQDVLAEITDVSHLHVVLTVFEQDIPKLKVGQKLQLTLANQPEKIHQAKVFLINPQVRPDRSIEVHCHLDIEDATLPPNGFLTAQIELAEMAVPALPNGAFVNEAGADYIFVAQPPAAGKPGIWVLQMVKVEKGITDGNFTEVRLAPTVNLNGQQVVQKGAFTLLSQMKVSVEEED